MPDRSVHVLTANPVTLKGLCAGKAAGGGRATDAQHAAAGASEHGGGAAAGASFGGVEEHNTLLHVDLSTFLNKLPCELHAASRVSSAFQARQRCCGAASGGERQSATGCA